MSDAESSSSSFRPSSSPQRPTTDLPAIAPFRSFPKAPFASVEYPGSVSHPSALLKVIAQEDINNCFNAPASEPKILEMRYGGADRGAIPVRGVRVPSQKLLLKVTKRRRRADDDENRITSGKGKQREGAEEGVFTAEIVGPIAQTVRFRDLADYQYTPNPDGRISQLVAVLKDLDYETILDYAVPPLDENYVEAVTPPLDGGGEGQEGELRSTLDLQPPPMFSDRRVPMVYNFRHHPSSYVEEVEDERTGEVRQRMVNKTRFIGHSVIKIGHGADASEVPKEPHKSVKEKLNKLDPRIVQRFNNLLKERPIWLRHALLAQFTDADRKVILRNKAYLPTFVYTFGAGPFWKTLVRYGYDPRTDPSSRIYQRIYFYIYVQRTGRLAALESPEPDEEDEENGKKSKSGWEAEQEELVKQGKRPPMDKSRGYIFDGQILHRDRPDYQLCDIIDPMIKKYIDDPENVSDHCDHQNGWYKAPVMDLIKALTRVKYTHVREKNEPAPSRICYDVIEDYERGVLRRQKADEDDGEEQMDEDEDTEK